MNDEPIHGIARYLYEHARDIILVIDAGSGRIVEANRAAESAYGYTRDELCALTIYDLRVEASGRVTKQMQAANNDGLLFETTHRRADGSTFPVEVSSRGDIAGERRLLFSIIRDISERRQLEALRDEFLLIASHELRTPIANVGLQLQQLRRMIERDVPVARLRTGSDGALRELVRLSTLVDSLLDARHDTDLALALDQVDLAELLEDVAARQRAYAELVCSPITVVAASFEVRCDRVRVDQVVVNLVTNALKFGAGHPIELRLARCGEHALVDVTDHGIGISPEDATRIFEKFARAVPSEHFSGFGLGLYIARRIVEAHAGTISVESAPASGATFRVALPIVGP